MLVTSNAISGQKANYAHRRGSSEELGIISSTKRLCGSSKGLVDITLDFILSSYPRLWSNENEGNGLSIITRSDWMLNETRQAEGINVDVSDTK